MNLFVVAMVLYGLLGIILMAVAYFLGVARKEVRVLRVRLGEEEKAWARMRDNISGSVGESYRKLKRELSGLGDRVGAAEEGRKQDERETEGAILEITQALERGSEIATMLGSRIGKIEERITRVGARVHVLEEGREQDESEIDRIYAYAKSNAAEKWKIFTGLAAHVGRVSEVVAENEADIREIEAQMLENEQVARGSCGPIEPRMCQPDSSVRY